MAVWTRTKAQIDDHIRAFYQDALGGDVAITFAQAEIISDAINQALIDVSMDYGLKRFSFLNESTSIDTVANQAYVDLTSNISGIISGTVRIESNGVTLGPMNLDNIKSIDPGLDQIGCPAAYAFDVGSTADLFTLHLWPIPDAVYTINFEAKKIIDEDGVSEVPSWFHPALQDKAKSIALQDLRLYQDALVFRASYEDRKVNAKQSMESDAPMYIRRPAVLRRSNLQQRSN